MKRIALLALAALAAFAPSVRAQNCNQVVLDQAKVITSPNTVTSAASTLINQGADVHVVTVASISRYGTNLSAVETYLERTACPSWTVNGRRKANLFVVMVAPNDKQKNIFLGSYYDGAFDVTPTYSQLSNTYFRNGQWDQGLAAVLQGTTQQALAFHRSQTPAPRTFAPSGPGAAGGPITTTTTQDSGSSHVLFFVFGFLLLGLVGLTLYLLFRRGNGVDTYSTGSGTDTTGTPATPGTGYTADPAPATYTPQRSYAAAAPSHTTIINNTDRSGSGDGFVSGLVVGEMLSRPSQPSTVYVERPAYEPAPMNPGFTEPTPATDAPDSSWSQPSQPADTGFSAPEPDPEPAPSFDPPSSDFGGGSSDSGFGGGDSGFGGGSSGGDSGF